MAGTNRCCRSPARGKSEVMSGNLYLLFRDRFPEDDTAIFLEHDRKTILYSELDELSGRYAAVLRRYGVGPGDRVLVQADKSPESVILYLACLRAGAVFLPINTAYTASEIDFLVGDSKPTVVVCRPAALEEVVPVAGKCSQPANARRRWDRDAH